MRNQSRSSNRATAGRHHFLILHIHFIYPAAGNIPVSNYPWTAYYLHMRSPSYNSLRRGAGCDLVQEEENRLGRNATRDTPDPALVNFLNNPTASNPRIKRRKLRVVKVPRCKGRLEWRCLGPQLYVRTTGTPLSPQAV